MHQSNSFVKKTAKGKVLKVVREHYLRDDIFSGTELDPACDPESHKLSPAAKHYLLIDTNVALHQVKQPPLSSHAHANDGCSLSFILTTD